MNSTDLSHNFDFLTELEQRKIFKIERSISQREIPSEICYSVLTFAPRINEIDQKI